MCHIMQLRMKIITIQKSHKSDMINDIMAIERYIKIKD